jgi:hypothetical protein
VAGEVACIRDSGMVFILFWVFEIMVVVIFKNIFLLK